MSETPLWPCSGTVLFSGPDNVHHKAYDYAKRIVCEANSQNLALWEAGSHPDFKVIQPEDSRFIKIDQIREITDWIQARPSISTHKVAIFCPADALNIQAANALLKTLEEPAATTLFILITARPDLLLPTIRSRCYRIREDDTKGLIQGGIGLQEVSEALFNLSQGKQEATKLAESWAKKDVNQILYWMLVQLNDTVKQAALSGNIIRHKTWWAFFDKVLQAKKTLDDKVPANLTLLLETLLIHYVRLNHAKFAQD